MSFLTDEERRQWQLFQRSLDTEMGIPQLWPPDFATFCMEIAQHLDKDERRAAMMRHPEWPDVVANAQWAIDFEGQSEAAKTWERMDVAALFAKAELDHLEANPSNYLTHTDRRSLSAFDRGINLRWQAHYRRIAGSMSDQERLVYAMGIALNRAKIMPAVARTEMVVSALWGNGRGTVQWQLDPDYAGDNADTFYKAAQEHYGPPSLQECYDNVVGMVMRFAKDQPEGNVAQLLLPLLYGGNQWATSR